MNRLACTTEDYDELYARWLEKPRALLQWAEYDPKRHFLLDLCGGTGAISLAALDMGAPYVDLLDLNPRCPDDDVNQFTGRAEDLPKVLPRRHRRDYWNFVVCRQALGYLDLDQTALALSKVMAPKGVFVANYFQRPKWSLKPYQYRGRWFLEASGYVGRQVLHLQATAAPLKADFSAFHWHTFEEICRAFVRYDFGFVKRDLSATGMKLMFRYHGRRS